MTSFRCMQSLITRATFKLLNNASNIALSNIATDVIFDGYWCKVMMFEPPSIPPSNHLCHTPNLFQIVRLAIRLADTNHYKTNCVLSAVIIVIHLFMTSTLQSGYHRYKSYFKTTSIFTLYVVMQDPLQTCIYALRRRTLLRVNIQSFMRVL